MDETGNGDDESLTCSEDSKDVKDVKEARTKVKDVAKELKRKVASAKLEFKRDFAELTESDEEEPCVVDVERLLTLEHWFKNSWRKKYVYDALCSHFLDVRITNVNRQVVSEIRAATKRENAPLPLSLDNLFRLRRMWTQETEGKEQLHRLYKHAAKDTDRLLIELSRKKLLATKGVRHAQEFAERIRALRRDTSDWVKSLALVSSKDKKDFQSASRMASAGQEGEDAE